MRLRAVSEHVSAILLAAVVLGAGTLLLVGMLSWLTGLSSTLVMEEARYEVALQQALDIAYAAVNASNFTIVVLVTGPSPVTLYALYLNDTLVERAVAEVDGRTFTLTASPTTLEPLKAYTVYVNTTEVLGAASVELVRVKVVYEGGEVVATAVRSGG